MFYVHIKIGITTTYKIPISSRRFLRKENCFVDYTGTIPLHTYGTYCFKENKFKRWRAKKMSKRARNFQDSILENSMKAMHPCVRFLCKKRAKTLCLMYVHKINSGITHYLLKLSTRIALFGSSKLSICK